MHNADGPIFEITLKFAHVDERRTATICCQETLGDVTAPEVGEQIGAIIAEALMKLFPAPCNYDVANLRACVTALTSYIYESHDELFAQFPEKE